MYFVYFLRSQSHPDQTYIGYTKSLVDRLEQHNNGENTYTRRYMPWELETFVLAENEEIAREAERFFKSPSGQEKFKPYTEQENPKDAFFRNQKQNRKFGRSKFKVKRNDILLFSPCD